MAVTNLPDQSRCNRAFRSSQRDFHDKPQPVTFFPTIVTEGKLRQESTARSGKLRVIGPMLVAIGMQAHEEDLEGSIVTAGPFGNCRY